MTNKNTYISPRILITECELQDVIRTSGVIVSDSENYLKWWWGGANA